MTGNPNGFSWNKHFNRNVQEASCAPKWGEYPVGGISKVEWTLPLSDLPALCPLATPVFTGPDQV